MQETTADVRRDIEETRARVTQTLSALQSEVSGRKTAITDRVVAVKDGVATAGDSVQGTIVGFAREHPWYALATAVGIGLVIGRTGADEAAARATASGATSAAKSVAGTTAGVARAGVDRAKGLFHREGDTATVAAGAGVHNFRHDPAVGAIGSSAEDTGQTDAEAEESGIVYRLQTGIIEALGGDVLLQSMREEAAKIAGRRG